MSFATTSASTTFIDLATYSELEASMYGGKHAVTLFVSSVQKANWFSFIPVSLRHVSGTPDFGQRNVAASVNRSGDYVLHAWFRALIPYIGLNNTGKVFPSDAGVAWCRNLMHNLIEKCQITFNELIVQEFDNYFLDVYRHFKVGAAKQAGYDNMIGNVATMTTLAGNPNGSAGFTALGAPTGNTVSCGDNSYRSVPLPFWFSEDSGVALPVAALPFNEVKINYCFRRWQELVIVYTGVQIKAADGITNVTALPTVADVVQCTTNSSATFVAGKAPALVNPETYAHYAVVHNDERVKMGDSPRDILIDQIQEAQLAGFKDVSSPTSFDIRFSHSVVAMFFMAENTSLYDVFGGTYGRECSNYTTQSAFAVDGTALQAIQSTAGAKYPAEGSDVFASSQLLYENTPRYAMGSDYYMWTAPYYFAASIPEETGYHAISYSLDMWSQDPMGGTNHSKLANVSLLHTCSADAILAAAATPQGLNAFNATVPLVYRTGGLAGAAATTSVFPQKYRHVCLVKSKNIARVAHGSLGHPSL